MDTDLVVSDLTTSVDEIDVGGTITISSTLVNQGTAATTDRVFVGYYLSVDAIVDTSDTYVGSSDVFYSLGGNSSRSLSQSVVVPTNLQSGTYYIGAIADYTDRQPEANETNNMLVAANTLQINQAVDLVPTALNLPASDLLTGSSFALNATAAYLRSLLFFEHEALLLSLLLYGFCQCVTHTGGCGRLFSFHFRYILCARFT